MSTIVLERETYTPQLVDLESFARKMVTQFSYRPLQNNILEAKLLTALCEAGLAPFKPEAVREYKVKQKRDMLRKHYPYSRFVPFVSEASHLRWRTCDFSHYSAQIPVNILKELERVNKVILDKSITPQFRVEYLAAEPMEHYDPVVYDPFIAVSLENSSWRISEWHQILVWDEPSFLG